MFSRTAAFAHDSELVVASLLCRFYKPICISHRLWILSSPQYPPIRRFVDLASFWVRSCPLVCLYFFPVELSPSPSLKSPTSQGLRADLRLVHSGHMSCPAEHSFSDGCQHIHVALLDPTVSSSVPESPPLIHFHQRAPLRTNHVCHHSHTPTRDLVSFSFHRRPQARAPQKSLPHCRFHPTLSH